MFQPSQHNWRIPRHYERCLPCRRLRTRMIRQYSEEAQQIARYLSSEIGASTSPAPTYASRIIREPHTKKSVTIQLPLMTEPVFPTEPINPWSRKRAFSQVCATGPMLTGSFPFRPEPAECNWSPGPSQPSQFSTHIPSLPYLPQPTPAYAERVLPLDPQTREFLLRPTFATTQPDPLPTKPTSTRMPGAWPSETDEDDPVCAQAASNVASHAAFGVNTWSSLAWAPYNIFTTITGKLSGLVRRRPASAQPSQPEDVGPVPKRRRVSFEEHHDGPNTEPETSFQGPHPEAYDDPMDFGDPMDIDSPTDINQNIQLEDSPPESPFLSPNSAAASAAALRATGLFRTNRKPWPRRVTQLQVTSPPPEEGRNPQKKASEPKQMWKPLPPPKYKTIHDFFDHESDYSLPGLHDTRLTPKGTKIIELESQRRERHRLEEEKRENERLEQLRTEEEELKRQLGPLGLRRPKSSLVLPLNDEWEQKALAAAHNGHTEQNKWQGVDHRDGVQLTPRDFTRLVPETAWLNDNVIQAALVSLATYINDAAGVAPKRHTPKCVAVSSQYWSSFRSNPKDNLWPRGFQRNWGMTPANFLDIDTVLLPVNENSHWTVVVIRPSRRTVAYVDSFQTSGNRHLQYAYTWIESFLKTKYVASEWKTVHYNVPSQTNSYDCGMFVITNSIFLSLGIDPSGYSQSDMPLQRRRIAAMLLNGGFTGPFDLSRL
ncbi:cysteine proteinase [Whalleya microplaca]|nr:cysteine proteinase [Whalleya microplaca]